MNRPLYEIMLAAFDALPDNEWATAAAGRLRDSDNPHATAAIIDAELEQAAAYTASATTVWLRSLSTEVRP